RAGAEHPRTAARCRRGPDPADRRSGGPAADARPSSTRQTRRGPREPARARCAVQPDRTRTAVPCRPGRVDQPDAELEGTHEHGRRDLVRHGLIQIAEPGAADPEPGDLYAGTAQLKTEGYGGHPMN